MIRSNISSLEKISERIAVLTLENGKKNLLSEPEFIQQDALMNWLAENPQIQAMIITGAGRHFSHGADVSQFADGNIEEISQKLDKAKSLLNAIENLPILTAAAINGGCFGGGLEIALSCNFRVCSPKALLGLPEIMHGVIPGMSGIERFVRLLGKEKALQLCLCGEMMTAQTALEAGLITKITAQKEPLGETVDFLNELLKDKTDLQINSIMQTVNRTIRGDADPSGDFFAKLLKEVQAE